MSTGTRLLFAGTAAARYPRGITMSRARSADCSGLLVMVLDMNVHRFRTAAALAAITWLAGGVLRANDGQVAAETLFLEARKLMGQGQYADACPKLEQSQKLDPAVGTMLYLAECYERAGRSASAWVTFREAHSAALRANQPDRAKAALERAIAIEPRLTRLTIVVPPPVRVAGLVVVRDGAEVVDGLWGTAVPVDPGVHKIEVTAPGHAPLRVTIEPRSGSETFVVTPLAPLVAPAPSASAPSPASSAPIAPVTAASGRAEAPRSGRSLGLVIGGAGAAAIVGGFAFGYAAKSKWDSTRDECDADNACSQAGLDGRKAARSRAAVATVLGVVGLVGVGVGGALYLRAETGPAHAGLRVGGTF